MGKGAGGRVLGFGLSVANDRLFVRTTESNRNEGESIPAVAYLPPFAAIIAHEQRISRSTRRRIGAGLAGACATSFSICTRCTRRSTCTNRNVTERARRCGQPWRRGLAPGSRPKISDTDLRRLREHDPWELLQQTLREV